MPGDPSAASSCYVLGYMSPCSNDPNKPTSRRSRRRTDQDAIESTASQRRRRPLTDAECRTATGRPSQYVLTDANGLELLVTPAGAKVWRFRYRLRKGGKQTRVTLGRYPDMGVSEARAAASRHRTQVWSGVDPAVSHALGDDLSDVAARYLADRVEVWKPSTVQTYSSAIRTFTTWASEVRIHRVDELTTHALASFRTHAVKLPKRAKAKGRGVGRVAVVSTDSRRSAAAIDCELRAVKSMLQSLRKAGRLPASITRDAIAENLELLPIVNERPDPLRPAQLRALLVACERFDDVVADANDPDAREIGPLVVLMLLSGLRLGEALRLTAADVDLDELTLRVVAGKTDRERSVDLSVSPALARLLASLRFPLFPSRESASAARHRLIDDFGAPPFHWSTRNSRPGERSAPTLRSTCGCYLTCAPSIFGAASIYRAAAQLGHSVQVAERHYLGTLRRIPTTATTIEAAMGIETEIAEWLKSRGW